MTAAAPKLISNAADLADFTRKIAAETTLAVDLEADSFHCYTAQVCLLQIATPRETALIDPLALENIDPLKELLEDSGIRKIFHAADYDVRCLNRDFGVEIRNIFDTMTACKLLGDQHLGLADLLRKYFGVELDKRFQRANWSLRPLSEDMLHYAAEDTRYLHRLADIIEERLNNKNRLSWALEEFALLEQVRHNDTTEQLAQSLRETAGFNGRQFAALEILLHWRDSEARRRNRRYFQIISTKELAAAAAALPQTEEDLSHEAKMSPRLLKRYGADILARLEEARRIPDAELPVPPRHERRPRNNVSNRLIKVLKAWRKKAAERLEVDPGTLINNALLEDITRRKPTTLDALKTISGLKNWQVETSGAEIIALISHHLKTPQE